MVARQAARDRLTAGGAPRRKSNRAAAARTATKLLQQAHSGRDGDDGASSSEEVAADEQPQGLRRGGAVAEYDPLGPLPATCVCQVALHHMHIYEHEACHSCLHALYPTSYNQYIGTI